MGSAAFGKSLFSSVALVVIVSSRIVNHIVLITNMESKRKLSLIDKAIIKKEIERAIKRYWYSKFQRIPPALHFACFCKTFSFLSLCLRDSSTMCGYMTVRVGFEENVPSNKLLLV